MGTIPFPAPLNIDWTGHSYNMDIEMLTPSCGGSLQLDSLIGASPTCINQATSQMVGSSDGGHASAAPTSSEANGEAGSSCLNTSLPTPESLCSPSESSSSEPPSPQCESKDDHSRKYPCSHCDRRFLREYTRKVHEMTHLPKEQHPFVCSSPNCRSRFSRQHDRLRHEVLKHGQESPWTCELCGKFFSAAKNLERHTCTTPRRQGGSE